MPEIWFISSHWQSSPDIKSITFFLWNCIRNNAGILGACVQSARDGKATCEACRTSTPPGPKKLPLVGNLFDIPSEHQWEAYLRWSKRFDSDIIHLNATGTSVVILSSMEAVNELIEQRSSLYSDWAHLPMLIEWDFGIGMTFPSDHLPQRLTGKLQGFMKYGDHWLVVLVSEFNLASSPQNIARGIQYCSSKAVSASRTGRNPPTPSPDPSGSHDIMDHFRHMMGVTYRIDVRSSDDQYISITEEAMHGLSVASIPRVFLVVPGAGFKLKAKAWRKVTRAFQEVLFTKTK
ncbi:hypothetical protein DFH08DRAFT_1023831 [Mycena albidolilacea]|uniref:Uncharacterized protein n=1 Tax=Mycena albidolilacea TaxID=1033008 RepID=A0AAD6ZM51_9AGAR|nr:hypothetical protein DFH08DRAFT_1023831 [Mycena albidolilacea]